MSDKPPITDEESEALYNLHDHVYEMFFAQNAIVDMDCRDTITSLLFDGDDDTKALIAEYATKVEEFLQYAKDNPERIARSLAILKGAADAAE